MHEIKCPKCGEVFTVDESGYAAIVGQVRDEEFHRELAQREKQLAAEKEKDLALVRTQAARSQEQSEAQLQRQIEELKAQLLSQQAQRELAVQKALEQQTADLSARDQTITELQARLNAAQTERELAIQKVTSEKKDELIESQREIDKLTYQLKEAAAASREKEQELRESYKRELSSKDEVIAYYKDLKTRLSTKMVGETLEQHCEIEFNRLRSAAFPNAYFEKDNDARTGSKGDYIFRESTSDGIEFLSIMFEMKNEMDTTASKKRMRISSGNWIRTVRKRAANMPSWFPCWSRTASCMAASPMSATATPKCMSSVLSSSFPSSPCCGARHSIRWNTAGSWQRSVIRISISPTSRRK